MNHGFLRSPWGEARHQLLWHLHADRRPHVLGPRQGGDGRGRQKLRVALGAGGEGRRKDL